MSFMKTLLQTPSLALAALVTTLCVQPVCGQMDTGAAGRLQIVDGGALLEPKMGALLPTQLKFIDENRKEVSLGDYLLRDRPVILNLGYYGCPTLCGLVTNAMVDGLAQVKLTPAADFTIVSVSINPHEKPSLAREKKNSYLERYTKDGAGDHWHFLTGGEQEIRALAEAVGFGFRFNETTNQYDHDAGILLLSPEGKITGCLKGAFYDPRDLRLAIVEASEGRVGTVWDKIVLSCMTYDPATRAYSWAAWAVIRIAGAVTVLGILLMILYLRLQERRRALTPAVQP